MQIIRQDENGLSKLLVEALNFNKDLLKRYLNVRYSYELKECDDLVFMGQKSICEGSCGKVTGYGNQPDIALLGENLQSILYEEVKSEYKSDFTANEVTGYPAAVKDGILFGISILRYKDDYYFTNSKLFSIANSIWWLEDFINFFESELKTNPYAFAFIDQAEKNQSEKHNEPWRRDLSISEKAIVLGIDLEILQHVKEMMREVLSIYFNEAPFCFDSKYEEDEIYSIGAQVDKNDETLGIELDKGQFNLFYRNNENNDFQTFPLDFNFLKYSTFEEEVENLNKEVLNCIKNKVYQSNKESQLLKLLIVRREMLSCVQEMKFRMNNELHLDTDNWELHIIEELDDGTERFFYAWDIDDIGFVYKNTVFSDGAGRKTDFQNEYITKINQLRNKKLMESELWKDWILRKIKIDDTSLFNLTGIINEILAEM